MTDKRPGGEFPAGGVDAYADMVLRRLLSQYAERPVDFNVEGLRKVQDHLDPPLGADDTVLDVGCSSGEFVLEAARATGVRARLIGLDPDDHAYRQHFPGGPDADRFTFIKGIGEDIPLPDDAARVATAHNVLFRADDQYKMLDEMKRVVEPEGLIIVSTNGRMHAYWRHLFERMVALKVSQTTGMSEPLHPPAEGFYMEDVPEIVERSGGLEIIDTLVQRTESRITLERLPDYLTSLKFSVNHTDTPPEYWRVWRETVDGLARPLILKTIYQQTLRNAEAGRSDEPYFPDPVHRAMFVLRNNKGRALRSRP